jgi:riboflavin synthase
MFTGLIETVGTVRAATGDSPRRLTIASELPQVDVRIGDSIAIDGCCLTVVEKAGVELSFEAATETLSRTTLSHLHAGDRVNLERSLLAGGRLDGHLVMGHVDGIGVVRIREQRESALYLSVTAPSDILPLVAPRGSIAVAGVSLTVADVADGMVTVALIPHTLAKTTLESLRVGSRVNLEADILARYVARLVGTPELRGASGSEGSLTEEYLKDRGFL